MHLAGMQLSSALGLRVLGQAGSAAALAAVSWAELKGSQASNQHRLS